MSTALWIVQGLLAALFLFAGVMKLILPLEKMTGPVTLPGPFLRFIGVAEVLGALGLILPGLLRIRPGLTPLAGGLLYDTSGSYAWLFIASCGIGLGAVAIVFTFRPPRSLPAALPAPSAAH